jgi:hypothetical protein
MSRVSDTDEINVVPERALWRSAGFLRRCSIDKPWGHARRNWTGPQRRIPTESEVVRVLDHQPASDSARPAVSRASGSADRPRETFISEAGWQPEPGFLQGFASEGILACRSIASCPSCTHELSRLPRVGSLPKAGPPIGAACPGKQSEASCARLRFDLILQQTRGDAAARQHRNQPQTLWLLQRSARFSTL